MEVEADLGKLSHDQEVAAGNDMSQGLVIFFSVSGIQRKGCMR